MITLGLDPHPSSHTVAALDETGACLEALTVPNTSEGLGQLHHFASTYEQRQWAIEGAGNRFIAPFVGQLLGRGEKVINIAPSLTSQYRARRGRKKNDVVDAENAARALLANPHLPILHVCEQQRELKELTRTHRRLSGQLKSNRRALEELDETSAVRTVLRQVIDALAAQLKVLEQRIQALVRKLLPQLLELPGVGPVVAGVLLGEVGTTVRFASEDHFASYCGALSN